MPPRGSRSRHLTCLDLVPALALVACFLSCVLLSWIFLKSSASQVKCHFLREAFLESLKSLRSP